MVVVAGVGGWWWEDEGPETPGRPRVVSVGGGRKAQSPVAQSGLDRRFRKGREVDLLTFKTLSGLIPTPVSTVWSKIWSKC